jgi:glycosyltransferase involved in cell wall biosynthesis
MEFVLANLLRGAAHIHFEDGFGPDEAVRRLARRSLVRRLVLKGSHIVVPSRTLQAIADRDWRLNTQRVHYIPNGIAPMTSVRPACPSGLPLDLPLHLPRVIWAGALRPEKNPIRALHAFAALKDQAVLIVVGDGPLREPLQQEIDRLQLQDRVRLLGSRNDTRELIRQCDIMLVTSDTEQMPLVVLEAMDAGIPLVATDVGDIRFMVCEQNRPFVVPPTPLDLAEALNTLLAAHPLRRSIGQANRNRQRTVYHLDQMTEAYGRLFDDVLAGSAKRNGRDG